MAIRNVSPTEVFVSGSTSMHQYYFAKLSTAGTLIAASSADALAAAPVPIYVTQTYPKNYSGELLEAAGNVGFNSYIVMNTSGTATTERNTPVTVGPSGMGVVATTGTIVYGYTLEVFNSSGAIVPIKLAQNVLI